MWLWIAIGVGSFLGVSALVGLAVARILGMIAREISELQEADEWAMLPPTRASSESTKRQSEEEPAIHPRF